ncbi:hypothetical protein [Lichenifustis flavocetrariae]|uniref:Uncharacterized protein n=1 Tax=Lichenifustis flavocetrariae TaxID=2949735 RepID=A0AA42CL57_9HYPH|nr:hypothetical protein [Lichenifustis flavocetrariae]MCW6506965.1 hypothetical protein [Lichenifustis flavocetrariae]
MRDAKKAQAKRPALIVGRETTGATRAIRLMLPTIRELRASGVTWAAIAEALAEQKITQADGEPLTASRLTSIVGQIEAQDARKTNREETRHPRSDNFPSLRRPADQMQRLRLAPELTADAELKEVARPTSEDEIRRAHYAKHRHLFKKD